MLPFRHNPDDVLSPMHFTVPRPPPPPPPPLYHQNDGTPQFSILPTISRDTAQIDQDGRQAYHLPGREGGLGGAPVHLFSGSQSLTDSRSPSRSPSRTASIMTEEYEGGVDYPDSDDGRDKDPLDHSSVFTYSSVDSRSSRQQSWRRIQYSWRRRLRVQTRSSTLRNRHKVVSTVYGREGIASSLPDLGLYKTWDSRKALKEMKELKNSRSAAKGKKKAPQPLKVKKFRHLPNLEVILSRAIEEYAGHDLLDDSRQSRLYGNLLDTIARLRGEIIHLRNDLTKPPPSCPNCADKVILVPKAPEKPAARVQILYRVFCANSDHYHDRMVYEDEPTRRLAPSGSSMELKGDKRITNIEQYCAENKDISFILFKEQHCVTYNTALIFMPIKSHQHILRISSRKERLLIVSEVLLNAFNQVAKCSPQENITRDITQMPAPYLFLYHHRQLLSEHGSTMGGETEEHISLLLSFINEHYKDEYEEANNQFAAGIATKEHIEKLYCPNDIIVDKTGPKDRAYVVKSWLESKDGDLELPCWSWEYDGSFLRREDSRLRIIVPSHFGSPLSIIGVYPISMVDDESLKALRQRGRKSWSMKEQYFSCYSGNDVNKARFHHKARFMVDTATYFRMHRRSSTIPSNIVPEFDPWPPFIAREGIPDDLMILLLRPWVYGFDMHEKNWVQLYIEQLHPIKWNKKAFDQLVLEKKTKNLVKALIEVRMSAERMEDVIEGKGNGLIMLLHGSPGTGKTLTAESVAEIAEKPLYRVTCGDLGTRATDVEKYMQTVLYLGKIWGCVLLLDEADVFLEERTTGYADLERNSLVSVFLRILEYYDGILILTSNRVGIFDEAFKSRIQVSLHYEDHTASARKAIWKNFFNILESSGANADISELEDHLEELSEEVLNGRQIRNAVTTARQLALHQKQRMDWTHLEQALSTAKEFDRYLKKVQGGHSDKQWARDNRWR